MHVHSKSETVHTKHSSNLRSTLIHLGVAVFAVLFIPWLLNAITAPKVSEIRKSNPQYNNNSQLEYYKGRINKVKGEIKPENSQDLSLIQQLDVKPLEGPDKGEIFSLETQVNKLSEASKYKEGDTVILVRLTDPNQARYFISERYRLDQVNLAIMLFIVLVLILIGIRGVTALAGLVFSILAITNFLIPMILIGQNVVLITFITGLFIIAFSLFLSHGFNKVVLVSIAASVITITISTVFSVLIVNFIKLTGTGSDDAYQLQFSNATQSLNFQGLFLSAIIIGTLGILDDITTSQAATVSEISRANPKLSAKQLYLRGLNVGKEHIISLVNTLGLAYVSVAMPLIMYYIIYNPQPLWVTFNSENVVEEIIRTIVGSSALLLAVPITTILAAKFLRHKEGSVSVEEKTMHIEEKHSHHNHATSNLKNYTKQKFNIAKTAKTVALKATKLFNIKKSISKKSEKIAELEHSLEAKHSSKNNIIDKLTAEEAPKFENLEVEKKPVANTSNQENTSTRRIQL